MADGRSSSEFQGSCPCSSRSRARFGRRSAGRAHLALGLGAGVAGASRNLGARQAPRAHLPRTRLPTLWSHPARAHLSRTAMPASHPAPAPAPKGRRNPPLPSEARPGHLPASFPRSGPRRPGHPRPEPNPASGAGRSPPRSYLAESPGKPREPRPRSSVPGSRDQEAAQRGREDEALTAAEEEPVVWGHLLAGRTERTARAGPETVQKEGGRVLLLRAGLRGRGGGGEG